MLKKLSSGVALMLLLISNAGLVQAADNLDAKWRTSGCSYGVYRQYVAYHQSGSSWKSAVNTPLQYAAGKWNSVGRELFFKFYDRDGAGSHPNSCRIDIYTYGNLAWPNANAWATEVNFRTFLIGDIERAEIRFNTPPPFGVTWYDGIGTPSSTQIDRWSVAMHELGHAVALQHTTQSSSDSMWPYFDAGERRRNLTPHDQTGIALLYPPK